MYQSIIASGKKRSYRASKTRDFILPDEDQRFAVIRELLGNGRANALCDDGVTRLARIRGSLRKGPNKAIISKGDLVIVSNREFEDKVDLVHKYNHQEASSLFRTQNIGEHLKRAWNNDETTTRDHDDIVDFAESDDERDVNVDAI